MSRFYGKIKGERGEATRCGHRGMRAVCASWTGAVESVAYDVDGEDWVRVSLIPWHGVGVERLLYDGPIGGEDADEPDGQTI
jgi:hypothetical protein